MSLNDLENKLYDPNSGVEKREHEVSQFDPVVSLQADPEKLKEEKTWEVPSDESEKINRKKIIKIGGIALGSILLISLIVVAFVIFRRSAFKQDQVLVEIQGPAEVMSSGEVTYRIVYKNNNRADLRDAEILLNYSENFKPVESGSIRIENPSNSRISIGAIEGHSEGRTEIKGNFFAAKNNIVYINAVLQYKPENINTIFQSKKQIGVNVGSSPLLLEIEFPAKASSGNKVDYVFSYKNSSRENLDGLRLKAEYPDGFTFISSSTSPSENNDIWYLGNITPGESGKIIVSGKIEGDSGENKLIKAYLGYAGEDGGFTIYDQKEGSTEIISSMLSIIQTLKDKNDFNVDPGEKLSYVINYKNNGDIALKDSVVTVEIDSRIFDFSKLESNGSFDASKKIITWKASEIPDLSSLDPGKEGEINFSVYVLERIPVAKAEDKNFSAMTTAKIDSPSIPAPIGSNKVVSSDRLELKLNSRVVLDVKGFYKDDNLPNSGPLPPIVGQETSYTIHWKIINVSNDITETKVSCSLPTGVRWLGKTYPDGETVNFNERTNQVEWQLGVLKSGSGILDAAREVSFQIGANPQVNQVGTELKLLNPSVLTGEDSFTGKDIKVETKEKTINLPEDTSLEWSKFKVAN